MRPPVIPDHALLRPIGRGAYGEVWLARNVMGTFRAVKVIRREQFESARPFEREFAGIQRYEPVSRSSGGLVHVLHIGRNDPEQYFYYVMELADDSNADCGLRIAESLKSEIRNPKSEENEERSDGVVENWSDGGPGGSQHSTTPALQYPNSYSPRTLRSDLKRLGRLSTQDCLRLAIDVASGLAQLHRNGLVHRDVKPGNIIYVNGRSKLADIGLVTADGEGRTFVGTEGYIPPEGPGSPAADLYALGVVLYEASTGFSPERFPDVPAEWFTRPEGDEALELHEIILKACEGQREFRYGNAEAMQADLALLQSGQSVRHTRALERRYARLRLSGLIGTTLLVLAVGTALFASYRARVAAENHAKEALLRQQAQLSQAQAERAERQARLQLQSALYEEARALVLSKELGHRTRALDALRRAAGSTNAAELRRVAFAALGLPDLRLERESDFPQEARLMQLDPGLERIAVSRLQEPVSIYSVPDLRVLATLPATTNLDSHSAQWSPDGRFLAVKRQLDATRDRSDLEVWNVGPTGLLYTARGEVAYHSFCFHPQLPQLMFGCPDGAVSILDLETLKETRPFHLPNTPLTLAFSPDGQRFAASYQVHSNWVIAFHDATTGKLLGTNGCEDAAALIHWHPQGQWASVVGWLAGDWGRGVWLFPGDGGAPTLLGRHKIKTAAVSFDPLGRYLMSCGWEREMFCWDLETRQRAFIFPDAGYSLDWSADGTLCATVTRRTQRLQIYAFDRPVCLELPGNRGERLGPGAFSPDGRFLAIPDSQHLCVWDLKYPSRPVFLDTKEGPSLAFFSADSSQLFAISGPNDAEFGAWQIRPSSNSAGPPELIPLPTALPAHLNWAGPARSELVLTSEEGVTFVSQTNLASVDCRAVRIPSGHGTVSPDGRWLGVTYPYSPWVTVYRLPEVQQVARFSTSNFVATVRFAPAGDELTVINRGGVQQWDTATWQLKARQPGSPVSDSYVLYTPDGSGIWRVTNFRDTALLDRNTLEPILPLPSNVLPLAVSFDGRKLAVSVDDQHVQVWDMVELRKHFRELGLDWEKPQKAGQVATSSDPIPPH